MCQYNGSVFTGVVPKKIPMQFIRCVISPQLPPEETSL